MPLLCILTIVISTDILSRCFFIFQFQCSFPMKTALIPGSEHQGLQMPVENVYQKHPGSVSNWWLKLPAVNFPLSRLELYLSCDCLLFSPKLGCGSILETAPLGLNNAYLLSLGPNQGCPRVVDGGQFWLRVLGEEERLLASSKWGWGFSTKGSSGCTACKGNETDINGNNKSLNWV